MVVLPAEGTACRNRLAVERNAELLNAAAALRGDRAAFFWRSPDRTWWRVLLGRDTHGKASITAEVARLPAGLTPRELDVLTLLTRGLTNRAIAAQLLTSARTVSTHVEHVLAKLHQPTRAGAAAVAAACGWVRYPVPGGSEGDLPVGTEATRAAPASSQTAPRRPSGRARPLLIGSAAPLTGPAAADGEEMRNGSALAIAEINDRGGIGGRRIEHVVVDVDIFSAEGVEQAFANLFAHGVDAITTGYVFSEDAARRAAAAYQAPYLHCMTSEAQALAVSEDYGAHRNIFQVCPTERHYGSAFVRLLGDLERSGRWHPINRRLVFLDTTLASGRMVNELTIDVAARSGWHIEAVKTVGGVGADWPAVAEDVVRSDPAAVMVTQFLASELAAFQREMTRHAPHILVYAVYAPSIPQFGELAGPSAEGLVWATVTGTYRDTIGNQFRKAYRQAYGRPPGHSNAGIAYDQVHLLAMAWSAVANPSQFRLVSDQLRRIRYRGVNGSYYMDNPGQCGLSFPDTSPDPSLAQAHLVFQVQDGVHRIIAPAPYAESDFRWNVSTVTYG